MTTVPTSTHRDLGIPGYQQEGRSRTGRTRAREGSRRNTWAIVLAAGEGKRVRDLKATGYDHSAPKQFWTFDGKSSMLRWAIERAARIVPRERIVTVVAEQHRKWWEQELSDIPPANLLVQEENRGTAAGVLLPLLHIRSLDPRARVVLLPSDHFVARESRLLTALSSALEALRERPDRAILLGVTAEEIEEGYGWVVPCHRSAGPLKDVRVFVEKPSLDEAVRLFDQGALVNSFIVVARVRSLLQFYEAKLPKLLDVMREAWGRNDRRAALGRAYRGLPVSDFSRDLLQEVPRRLGLVPVPACGWTDLGTPPRVYRYLEENANGKGVRL